MYSLIEALQPVANMIAYRFREREIILGQHRRLLGAIEDQDINLAKAIIKEQIEYLDLLHGEAQSSHQEAAKQSTFKR